MAKRIDQLYEQELKMEKVFLAIKDGFDTTSKIFNRTNITRTIMYHYIEKLEEANYIKSVKLLDKESKIWLKKFILIKDEFIPASIEELEASSRQFYKKKDNGNVDKKGPYDDLINSNPNLKVYKPFENGYQNVRVEAKVNRRPSSSFAIYDMF